MSLNTNNSRDEFQFDLITPDKIMISEKAYMALIPSEMGEFGVLAEHSALLSSVSKGILTIHLPDGAMQMLFVSNGFADVSETLCTVLVEDAVDIASLKEEDVVEEIKALKQNALSIGIDNEEAEEAREEVRLAEIKLRALRMHKFKKKNVGH